MIQFQTGTASFNVTNGASFNLQNNTISILLNIVTIIPPSPGMLKLYSLMQNVIFSNKTNTEQKEKSRNALFIRFPRLVATIQTLFRVRFFMLLYCYFVSKPYHSDTVLCLVNMVSKLLYPNCTHAISVRYFSKSKVSFFP